MYSCKHSNLASAQKINKKPYCQTLGTQVFDTFDTLMYSTAAYMYLWSWLLAPLHQMLSSVQHRTCAMCPDTAQKTADKHQKPPLTATTHHLKTPSRTARGTPFHPPVVRDMAAEGPFVHGQVPAVPVVSCQAKPNGPLRRRRTSKALASTNAQTGRI